MLARLAFFLFLSPAALADEASPTAELSTAERVAIENALDESHRAVAHYAKVQLEYDDTRVFSELLEVHRSQVTSLSMLLMQYGEAVPASRWAGRVHSAPSLLDACSASLDVERAVETRHDTVLDSTEHELVRTSVSALVDGRSENEGSLSKCVEKAEKKARKGR